ARGPSGAAEDGAFERSAYRTTNDPGTCAFHLRRLGAGRVCGSRSDPSRKHTDRRLRRRVTNTLVTNARHECKRGVAPHGLLDPAARRAPHPPRFPSVPSFLAALDASDVREAEREQVLARPLGELVALEERAGAAAGHDPRLAIELELRAHPRP